MAHYWTAPDVGYVDGRGNLRCIACATEDSHKTHPVAGDQGFGEDDKCCQCGKQMEHVRTKDYVRVECGYGSRGDVKLGVAA